jgi:hypothetical protein
MVIKAINTFVTNSTVPTVLQHLHNSHTVIPKPYKTVNMQIFL